MPRLPDVPRTDPAHLTAPWAGTDYKRHPGRMRVSLAVDALREHLIPGAAWDRPVSVGPLVVVDPMCGIGTTGVALDVVTRQFPKAFPRGWRFCGVDIDPWCVGIAEHARRALGGMLGWWTTDTDAQWTAEWVMAGLPVVQWFNRTPVDLIFTSPPFPSAHALGSGEKQRRLRVSRHLDAGANMAGDWPADRAGWTAELVKVLRPWVGVTRHGGVVAVHVRRHIVKSEVQYVDAWASDALRELGVVVQPEPLVARLGYTSAFREWGRHPMRMRDPGDRAKLTPCGHPATTDRDRQRCRECPALHAKVADEVQWEVVVVGVVARPPDPSPGDLARIP